MIGVFHFATGSNANGGGWWFEPRGGDPFKAEIQWGVEDPPVEKLVEVEFAEDGETVRGWTDE